jgi:hypothetical protein
MKKFILIDAKTPAEVIAQGRADGYTPMQRAGAHAIPKNAEVIDSKKKTRGPNKPKADQEQTTESDGEESPEE